MIDVGVCKHIHSYIIKVCDNKNKGIKMKTYIDLLEAIKKSDRNIPFLKRGSKINSVHKRVSDVTVEITKVGVVHNPPFADYPNWVAEISFVFRGEQCREKINGFYKCNPEEEAVIFLDKFLYSLYRSVEKPTLEITPENFTFANVKLNYLIAKVVVISGVETVEVLSQDILEKFEEVLKHIEIGGPSQVSHLDEIPEFYGLGDIKKSVSTFKYKGENRTIKSSLYGHTKHRKLEAAFVQLCRDSNFSLLDYNQIVSNAVVLLQRIGF